MADCELVESRPHWTLRFLKSYLGLNISYPYFSPGYIRAHIRRPDTEARELHEYEQTSRKGKLGYLLIVSSIIYILRVSFMNLIMVRETNLLSPVKNLHQLSDGRFRFNCLVTNCSRLAPLAALTSTVALAAEAQEEARESQRVQLAKTLISLPTFAMCHEYRYLHDASQFLGNLSLLMSSAVGFSLVLTGTILPIVHMTFRTGNLLLMFLVAPKVTRRVVQDRAKQLLEDLLQSHANYSSALRVAQLADGKHECCSHEPDLPERGLLGGSLLKRRQLHGRNAPAGLVQRASTDARDRLLLRESDSVSSSARSGSHYVGITSPPNQIYVPPLSCLASPLASAWDHSTGWTAVDEEAEERMFPWPMGDLEHLARDCATVMRSQWWHAAASQLIKNYCFGAFCYLFLASVIGVALTWYYVRGREARMQSIGTYMRLHLNCSIWRIVNKNSKLFLDETDQYTDEDLEPFDLESDEFDISWMITLIYIVQCLWPFLCVQLKLVLFLLINHELGSWLQEVKFYLIVGTEFARQLCEGAKRPRPARWGARHFEHASAFELDILRDQFTEHSRFRLLFLRKYRFASALAVERFARETIFQRQLDLKSAAELMAKLYICQRIFVDHVHHYGPTITTMIAFLNAYTYGFVIIGVWYLRSTDGFIYMPILLMTVGWLAANVFILIASQLHAKAKQLHALIWSLIAATSNCDDIHMRHMRCIWLKQVQALDLDGGLALKAFNVRITYLRIVQLIIGSGTLLVFALRL